MNDTYSELLIKKEVTAKDKMIKVLLIALIALMAVAGILITPLAFIAAIALGIAAYFVFPNLDLEFGSGSGLWCRAFPTALDILGFPASSATLP